MKKIAFTLIALMLLISMTACSMVVDGINTKRVPASNNYVTKEYKLTDFFSLYAEPGLGYFFKDGSTIPTIYQDHPLNFNLSFGLRFNLK